MNIFLPVAFKPITDEEILDTIIQSAWAEMTSIHINQTPFIWVPHTVFEGQSVLMNACAWMFALHSL